MKVWITTHALTSGIRVIDAELGSGENTVFWKNEGAWGMSSAYGEGKNWHRSEDSALKRAENMRKNKIVSLRLALSKYEKMRFVAEKT